MMNLRTSWQATGQGVMMPEMVLSTDKPATVDNSAEDSELQRGG